MRIALGVEYDGAAFSGYQFQSNAPSVQQSLQEALSEVAAQPITLQAAGRTDAGVHATAQVVAFDTDAERSLSAWIKGSNALTPPSISVNWARTVASDFQPRFSATARRYMYLFYESAQPSPLLEGRAVQSSVLDDESMHGAAQTLVGEHDFSAFRAARCQSKTPFRCVHQIQIRRTGAFIVVDISANAFLLHMVRNIAGSLWQIGLGRQSRDWLQILLAAEDRTRAAPTAPPQGLYLVDVRYPGQDFPAGRLPGLLRSGADLSSF